MLANGGKVAPFNVESGQNFLSSLRVLTNDLLSLYPLDERVVHQALQDQVGYVHMIPLLVIDNKVVTSNPNGPHSSAPKQEPMTLYLLEAARRVRGE
jgi:hypothetical protein